MDREFLDLYERELRLLKEHGREFAEEYPGIADRLGQAPLLARNGSTIRVPDGVPSVLQRVDPLTSGAMKRRSFPTDVNP